MRADKLAIGLLTNERIQTLILADQEALMRDRFMTVGITGCVVDDWANEIYRREKIRKRARMRKFHHRPCGEKGSGHRRIIYSHTFPGLCEINYHATKGWRTYRVYE